MKFQSAHSSLEQSLGKPAPWLVGILNITPDSFSDGGAFLNPQTALDHAEELARAGAAIIDVGGVSTGIGTAPIEVDEEIRRISEVVRKLAPRLFLSVDTYNAGTAEHCLKLGARMINDVSALRHDPAMLEVLRKHGAFAVLMYSKEGGENPHVSKEERDYKDLIQEIGDFLCERIDYLLSGGLSSEQIIVDPGMGRFLSHDPKYSWQLLRNLDRLVSYLEVRGFTPPLMIGTSRKGFLGGKLAERDPASQLTGLLAVNKGAVLVRTHNPQMANEFFSNVSHIS